MKGYIVYPTYETEGQKTYVHLFGRLENGQSFLTIHEVKPYFFMRTSDLKKIPDSLPEYIEEKTKYTNFANEPVTKIATDTIPHLTDIHDALDKKVPTYEADIKPHMRFLIEHQIKGSLDIEGEYTSSDTIDRIYRDPDIKSVEYVPKLKVAVIDIESDKHLGKLFCIGLVSDKYRKTFMVTKHASKNIVPCDSEADCLEKFIEELAKLDPDIITGWNIIDFDLKYLQTLCKKNKVKARFGRTNDEMRLRIESNFFKSSSADVPGRQVLDALNLIKDPFIREAPSIKNAEFESYTLEDVSQAILKKGKLIVGKNRHEEIEELYKEKTGESHQKLAEYNLTDCDLVYEMLEKTNMIDLAIQRTQLTGLSLDRLTGSIAAFDSLYMRAAHKQGLVSPTMNFRIKETRITGGYVQSLKPGIYNNVLVLDFKSLYPSIIRTFNIDPASYTEKKEKNTIEAPNGALFKNQDGVLPKILDELHEKREQAKKEKRELANYAIKIIMNSFFGVLASPKCRYFNLNIANAITHFGQHIIKLTAHEVEKKGHRIIYSDTDSVFVETNLEKTKANALGKELQDYINEFYKNYVQENYKKESKLELQFDKQYLKLMIPKVRNNEKEEVAAKKRYAGLVEKNGKEELEVIGLEAIRGDWTDAAKEFQVQLLMKLFHNEPVEEFIRAYMKKLLAGEMDKKLVYRKKIRKALEDYTKTTPPHVKAARLLDQLDSNTIEYYVTIKGPEPIQKHIDPIDYDHYIEKQIKPIANQILSLFEIEFEDLKKKSKQAKLF